METKANAMGMCFPSIFSPGLFGNNGTVNFYRSHPTFSNVEKLNWNNRTYKGRYWKYPTALNSLRAAAGQLFLELREIPSAAKPVKAFIRRWKAASDPVPVCNSRISQCRKIFSIVSARAGHSHELLMKYSKPPQTHSHLEYSTSDS